MTRTFYTSCKQLPAVEYKKAVSLLPNRMQARIAKYWRWQDAHAYLYGRLLLKHGMRLLGFNNPLEQMNVTKYGKPYFPDSPFSFNISHSEEYIVCVISSDEKQHLGIDIEKIKPLELKIFDSVWSPQEKKELDGIMKFYTYWTRKEAIVKADGRGMHIPFNMIDTTEMTVQLDGDNYYLSKVNIDKEYIIHVASLIQIEKMDPINCLLIAPDI